MRNSLGIMGFLLFVAITVPHTTVQADHIQACTMQYAPVCGMDADGEEQTFGNRCTLDADHARFVHEGECGGEGGGSSSTPGHPGVDRPMPTTPADRPIDPPQPEPLPSGETTPPDSCMVWYDGCNTCQKDSDGFWACTEMACMQMQKPYCIEGEGSFDDTGSLVDPDQSVSWSVPRPFIGEGERPIAEPLFGETAMPVSQMMPFGANAAPADTSSRLGGHVRSIPARPTTTLLTEMRLSAQERETEKDEQASPLRGFFERLFGGLFGGLFR